MSNNEPEKIPIGDYLVRIGYAAEVLGKSKDAVHKMVQKGLLRHVRQGQVIYFRVKWLTEYMDSLPECVRSKRRKPAGCSA